MEINDKITIKVNDSELREIYNGLCCLNISIRNKQKSRAKIIQKIIKEITEQYEFKS